MHRRLYFTLILISITTGIIYGQTVNSNPDSSLKLEIEEVIADPGVSHETKIDTLIYFLNYARKNLNTTDIAFAYQNLAAINYDLENINEALLYYKLYTLEIQRLKEIKDFRKQEFETSLYRNEINALNKRILTLEKEIESLESAKQEYFESNYLIYLGLRIVVIIAAVLMVSWLYIRYKKWKKAKKNTPEIKEAEYQDLTGQLVKTREQLSDLQTELDLSGILIQYSVQDPAQYFDNNKSLRKKFLIHQPKKLAGGDGFYLQSVKNNTIVAVFDTPGHGVSGGLLSSQITLQIDDLVTNHGILSPSLLISQLDSKIRSLFPAGIPFPGGIEIGICLYNSMDKSVTYAGARLTLVVNYKGIINRYRGEDILLLENDNLASIPNSTFEVHKGMKLYLSTDGFYKQKGGHEIKPLGINAYENAIESMYPQSINEHGKILTKILSDWKGSNEQDDDILVFGFGF